MLYREHRRVGRREALHTNSTRHRPPKGMNIAPTLLQRLPPVDVAIAYGSGVFKQISYSSMCFVVKNMLYCAIRLLLRSGAESPMVDLLLAVEDPKSWHRENFSKNLSHYSSILTLMGSDMIASVQVWRLTPELVRRHSSCKLFCVGRFCCEALV